MEQIKEYYAFISYKREDKKDAKRLQHALEYYRLPNQLRQENPGLPKYVRPVFRDMTELEVGELSSQIHAGLEQSHYLIVVCSPRAASSKWVNDEVEYFISLGKQSKIIPYIIKGVPHACNPDDECFPPALLKISNDNELLGANINDVGRSSATIRVISKMFGLRYDTLYRRFEREERRKWRICLYVLTLIALLGFYIGGYFVRQNSIIQNQKAQLDETNWNLMSIQSKAVSGKAMELINEGDYYTAAMLAIAVLPDDIQAPNRPLCSEAEKALRSALSHNGMVVKGHIDEVNTAFFNHDGSRIVSSSDDGTIRVWDAMSGSELYCLDASAGFVSTASFSPNSNYIVAGYNDCNVRIWDIHNKTVTKELKGHTGGILCCSYSHNGDYIVSSAGGDNTIRIWNAESGEQLRIIEGPYNVYNHVSFSPDDKYIVSAGMGDDHIRIYDVVSGKEVKTMPSKSVNAALFSNDGKHIIASSCNSNDSQIWDFNTGKKEFSLRGHTDYVYYSTFSPDGKHIASASCDSKIIIWDVKKRKQTRVISGHTGPVNSVSYSADGKKLVSASADKTIRVWDLYGNANPKVLKGEYGYISCADISPTGEKIVSSSRSNGELHIWDWNSGKDTMTLKGHEGYVFTVNYSPDGRLIMSASMDNTIRLWDANSGELRRTYNCGMHLKGIASFSPDGKLIAYGDGAVLKIIDASNGQLLRELCARNDNVDYVFAQNISSITFSPNGRYIATATYLDKTIRVWDIEAGTLFRVFNGHRDAVTSVAFSPDGSQLVSSAYDCSIRIWSLKEDNHEIIHIESDTSLKSVAYSPDGKYIVAGGWGKIYVWDAETSIEMQTLIGHTASVNSVTFSSDGKTIVSSSDDGTIRVWDFPPLQEIIDQARNRFKDRQLTPDERRRYYLE